jgi:mannose-6-phosphate isomerase-like protein (cupin superfamily)
MSAPTFRPRVLLRSEQSGGEVSVMENAVPGRWAGPPLHHHGFDEGFYVLEGELTFQLGDQLSTARPGEFVFAPRGSVHTLANRSERPARYLLICTPAGFERYFARIAAEQAGEEPPEWALGETPPTEVVGPPIELDEKGAEKR